MPRVPRLNPAALPVALLATGLAAGPAVPAAAAERAFTLLDDASAYLVMDNQSAAVRTEDGFVFTAGITGMDPNTRRFVADDAAAQMAAAMDNLEAILKAAGATLADLVQVTFWTASLDDYRAANPVYVARMAGHRPARSVMGFTPWDPRFRVQIQAVAKVRPQAPAGRPSPPSPVPPAAEDRVPAILPAPPGPGWQAPARAADIAACSEPVLMLVMGALSERGFAKPEGAPMSYGEALRASGLYQRLDGFYLLSGRPLEVFEGDWTRRDMALVAEFPCLEAARAFYWSKAYQEIIPLRAGAGDFFLGVWPKRSREEMGRPPAAAPASGLRSGPGPSPPPGAPAAMSPRR